MRPFASQNLSLEACRKAVWWWLPLLYLLISDTFYLRTYDSAQVKITLVQMGGLCLLSLWLCLLIEEGRKSFQKEDLVFLAPFLAYLCSGILSFLHTPYPGPSLDEFLRRNFYMLAALIVVREFDEPRVARLTKVLIWTTAITAVYGLIQVVDGWFPPGIGNGVDPFIWRGAFGHRAFSTFGNPNFFADFLVIISPVLVCQYLKTRSFLLIPLTLVVWIDLFKTETKGAWVGFAISAVLFILLYAAYFMRETLARVWKKVAVAALIAAVVPAAVVGYYAWQRMTSVNFRLFTWESTWEMIQTRPLLGTGIGSFKVIYPSFRRPAIFHIEGKHNTETDHAEDEYLEVWFDEGLIGFGIFLWLILSVSVMALGALGQLTESLKGGRPPPRAYDLLGYFVAFLGMLAHNFFDVSLRFVSSGVYMGLLSGLIVVLSRGSSLSETHLRKEAAFQPVPEKPEENFALEWALGSLKALVWAGLIFTGSLLVMEFSSLQGPLKRIVLGGELLQWWISWTVFLSCIFGLGWAYFRILYHTRRFLVPLVIGGMLYPLYLCWGFFKADVHHNLAIAYSKSSLWDQAIENYLTVNRYNPAFIMAYYFKGNVFNDRFRMQKEYNPKWGDKDDVARDDFERALAAYEEVRALAPNYVQMHHQVGALFMRRADYAFQNGDSAGGQFYWDQALVRFKMYQNLDPVFAPNYHRMAQIHMARQQHDLAIKTYLDLIEAKPCASPESFRKNPLVRKKLLQFQQFVEEEPVPVHRHEDADAYAGLGNAYLLKGDFLKSRQSYARALKLQPGHPLALRGMAFLEQKIKR